MNLFYPGYICKLNFQILLKEKKMNAAEYYRQDCFLLWQRIIIIYYNK